MRRWRWVVYAVAASVYFVSYFHRVAPAGVAPDLMRAFAGRLLVGLGASVILIAWLTLLAGAQRRAHPLPGSGRPR